MMFLFLACLTDPQPPYTFPQDADGDGFSTQSDCDDADPAVRPDAEEVCDGVDNNCDGSIDEGLNQWAWDEDGDGYTGDAVETCTPAEGAMPYDHQLDEDCDDTDPERSPGIVEVCGDGVDSDCFGGDCDFRYHGITAEPFPGLIGDGLFDGTVLPHPDGVLFQTFAQIAVVDREALLSSSGDMLDTVARAQVTGQYFETILPGDSAETVLATTQDGLWEVTLPDTGVATLDEVGVLLHESSTWRKTIRLEDLDGDGFQEIAGIHRLEDHYELWIFDGPVEQTEPTTLVLDQYYDNILPLGDTDGDGLSELLLASPTAAYGEEGAEGEDACTQNGAVYLYNSEITDGVAGEDAAARLYPIQQFGTCALAGWVLSDPGDFNGDGYSDVAFSGRIDQDSRHEPSSLFVFYGPIERDLTGEEASLLLLSTSLSGASGEEGAMVVAARSEATGYQWSFLLYGPLSGVMDVADQASSVIENRKQNGGFPISSVGDIDQDGRDDQFFSGIVLLSGLLP